MTQRQASRFADIFSGIVAISVAIALAGLTWRLTLLLSHRPPQISARAPAMPRSFATDIEPIVTLAPFGNPVDGPLQPTSLPLELRGVLLAVPSDASLALIVSNGGAVLPYKIGQPVPGGATVETLTMDRVILRMNGQRQLLAFPRANAGASPGGPAPAQTPMGYSPPPSPPSTAAAISAAPAAQDLLASLGATPVDGGYRVGDSASPAVRGAGLLPGDVITKVNGITLGNPAMDRQVLAAATRSGTVQIELMRNERRLTITVPLH